MIVWVDAQLSPAIAPWIAERFHIEAYALRDLGLRDARDHAIYFAARRANAIILTKDVDFVHLLGQFGPPPCVLWLRCGNTSNERLFHILTTALALLKSNEVLVELVDPW